jgi:hypothetical protein
VSAPVLQRSPVGRLHVQYNCPTDHSECGGKTPTDVLQFVSYSCLQSDLRSALHTTLRHLCSVSRGRPAAVCTGPTDAALSDVSTCPRAVLQIDPTVPSFRSETPTSVLHLQSYLCLTKALQLSSEDHCRTRVGQENWQLVVVVRGFY